MRESKPRCHQGLGCDDLFSCYVVCAKLQWCVVACRVSDSQREKPLLGTSDRRLTRRISHRRFRYLPHGDYCQYSGETISYANQKKIIVNKIFISFVNQKKMILKKCVFHMQIRKKSITKASNEALVFSTALSWLATPPKPTVESIFTADAFTAGISSLQSLLRGDRALPRDLWFASFSAKPMTPSRLRDVLCCKT